MKLQYNVLELYSWVWEQVTRLVSPLPPQDKTQHNHATDCDDSLGSVSQSVRVSVSESVSLAVFHSVSQSGRVSVSQSISQDARKSAMESESRSVSSTESVNVIFFYFMLIKSRYLN